ncbi:UbiX family flavin prenyltransferase [Mycobacterium intracellulare]|nr:UbiX family flavin prenyltransferase [Mycobacterium intracellulare]AOS93369.1 phenolic acid decarboxylase subunit B [Mycobacterium intracellulare subsp. chimaera]ARV83773.1 phenolic acid decarboxylase subunit B [Mycobacterium intracellulare subsp. chimaera]ASL11021.1 phenylacrylic acid decarboxylase [Mycobacterium intracellulare subsp. chimaera]ASL16914.1 phenylacrylic acid decarboxylase [Mycobacterium intracellulare subsp. chimaera]ASL22963.1 phenylacrylic acid decarboxylase [Mycobacterium
MRLVIAMTGATGATLGIRLLETLGQLGVETHLVLSDWARATIKLETDTSVDEVRALASHAYSARDLAASISSGSFRTDGMVVCPCSMKTLSAIRIGFSDNLITRAADVTLKERRRLVLVAREAPLSEIHLENMHYLARAGAVIFPPTVAYYGQPSSIDEVTDYIVGRIIDQLGIEHSLIKRWKDDQQPTNGNGILPAAEDWTTQIEQTLSAPLCAQSE